MAIRFPDVHHHRGGHAAMTGSAVEPTAFFFALEEILCVLAKRSDDFGGLAAKLRSGFVGPASCALQIEVIIRILHAPGLDPLCEPLHPTQVLPIDVSPGARGWPE